MTTRGKKVQEALSRGDFARSKPRVVLRPGEMVRLLREKNELTQKVLAERAQLTQATISSIENERVQLGVASAPRPLRGPSTFTPRLFSFTAGTWTKKALPRIAPDLGRWLWDRDRPCPVSRCGRGCEPQNRRRPGRVEDSLRTRKRNPVGRRLRRAYECEVEGSEALRKWSVGHQGWLLGGLLRRRPSLDRRLRPPFLSPFLLIGGQ